jgi:hypothetical protein
MAVQRHVTHRNGQERLWWQEGLFLSGHVILEMMSEAVYMLLMPMKHHAKQQHGEI